MAHIILQRLVEVGLAHAMLLHHSQLIGFDIYAVAHLSLSVGVDDTLCQMVVVEYIFHLSRLNILVGNARGT